MNYNKVKPSKMDIYAQTLTGKCITVEVSAFDEIIDLKDMIEDRRDSTRSTKVYICRQQLEDERTLADYGIQR